MRLHPFRAQHEQLVETIRDYSASGATVELQCYLGDLDLTELLEEGDISISDGSPAWTFSGTFVERIDLDYRGAPLRVVADIGGVELEIFSGRASLPIQNDDYSTTVVAGTPGIYLDKVTLDEQVTFNNSTPERAIRKALGYVPYYNRAGIYIPPFTRPFISRGLSSGNTTGSTDAFVDENHPIDIISSVQEEVDFVYWDTVVGGFRVIENPGIGKGLSACWNYETDSPEVLEPFSEPTPSSPDEEFQRVVVRDKYEDGSYRIWAEWPVDYSGLQYPPAAASTLYLPISDTSNEAFLLARQRGFETAEQLRSGTFTGSLTVAFNPLLEPYDLITIRDEHRDMTGRYWRHWQAILSAISLRWSGSSIDTELGYTSTIVHTERIPDPSILVDFPSPGVSSTPIAGFVLGLDYIGEWVDSARITGPLWAGEEEAEPGDWFDAALAPAGLLGEETVGGELLDYIDYVSAAGATYGEDDSEAGEWVDDAFISDPTWSGTEVVAFDSVALDFFEPDYAPLGLLGEDTSGPYAGLEWIDF